MLLDFKIDGKKYKIECPVEDQEKVLALAKTVDQKAQKLRSHLKTADEKTLLAILCLTIQDEVNSTISKQEVKKASRNEIDDIEEKVNLEAIKNVAQATKKIEDLAKKIERC